MLFGSSLCSLCLGGESLFAANAFPWKDGFYFNPFKLAAIVLVYLCWVRTAWWVDQDARALKLSRELWNALLLACGVAGMLLAFSLPFWAGFILLLLAYLGSSLSYVGVRNGEVDDARKVLTPRHLRALANHYLHTRLELGGDQGDRPIPIRFIGKSSRGEDDNTRVARAAGSRGYQAALEMVYEAITIRATDIHLEPTREEMTVRYRVDGILQASSPYGRPMGDAVVNIFKVLADLDITEKRKPQDGSFSAEVGSEDESARKRTVDFRVATAGSVVGEKLVMRILDRARQVVSLKQIGLPEEIREQVRAITQQPHGMLVVCGPTGAGKSTTLYACLSEIDRYQKNVITLENPVEYQIDNVTQIEVNARAGKTFASELRSILRQDPDVIYVGEVRDKETAEIACQAAQTGHLVFTTLHANDTVTALGRLMDLGVQPFMVASAVSAVLGQRLVRVLCPRCKQRYKPNPDMLRKANLPADKIKFFCRPPEKPEDDDKHEVCAHCGGSGYYGRTGVFELLPITDRIRELIRENPNLNAIKQEAVKSGMKYLQEEGLRLVIAGTTSIQELLRVSK
jgi:type II secretory ATPase GspE/PulE/Tfp pilus assembly ATPase PilB-like protein